MNHNFRTAIGGAVAAAHFIAETYSVSKLDALTATRHAAAITEQRLMHTNAHERIRDMAYAGWTEIYCL